MVSGCVLDLDERGAKRCDYVHAVDTYVDICKREQEHGACIALDGGAQDILILSFVPHPW